VIAGDHDPPVAGEAGENGEGRLAIEEVVRIEVRDMLFRAGVGGDLEIRIDPEHLTDGHFHVRQGGRGLVDDEHWGLFVQMAAAPGAVEPRGGVL
jgi:hypothetical protein